MRLRTVQELGGNTGPLLFLVGQRKRRFAQALVSLGLALYMLVSAV